MQNAPLLKFPAFAIAEMLGPDFARELEVKGAYFRPFADEELAPEPLRYESSVTNSDGQEVQLKDDRYLIFINPFDLAQVFVHDAGKRFLGTARRADRVDISSPEQVKSAFKRTAQRLSDLREPIFERHAETVKAETRRMDSHVGELTELAAEAVAARNEALEDLMSD